MSQEENDRLVLVVDTSKITDDQRERLRELQSRPTAILPFFESPSENEYVLADLLNDILHYRVPDVQEIPVETRRNMAKRIVAAGVQLKPWAIGLGFEVDPAQKPLPLDKRS